MKSLLRLRGRLIRALRRPLGAILCSRLGRGLLRFGLNVAGSGTTLALHDETLEWLTSRKLQGERMRLARRLRRGARALRYRPGILVDAGVEGGAPVTLVVAWGVSSAALATLVEGIHADHGARLPFAPIFVTDCDDFEAFRRRGHLFEYIPERREWTQHHGADGWPAYVSRRIRGIYENWDPDSVLLLYEDRGAALRRDGLWAALLGERS